MPRNNLQDAKCVICFTCPDSRYDDWTEQYVAQVEHFRAICPRCGQSVCIIMTSPSHIQPQTATNHVLVTDLIDIRFGTRYKLQTQNGKDQ